MSRKWIGVVVAIALAAAGAWVLVRYVQGADNRALEGEETVSVLIVDTQIAEGTPAENVSGSVRVELVPVKVQAPGSLGSVEDLASLDGLVAAVDLVPGEQVITGRFISPETLEEQDDIVVPAGMIEITHSLAPERAVGGILRPGDTVAIFASFEPFTLSAIDGEVGPDPGSDDTIGLGTGETNVSAQSVRTPNATHIILHKVLVTNVQVEELPSENTSDNTNTATLDLSPTGNLLVTLAMEPVDAERFVFTAEFGTVWLADEDEAVDEAGTSIQERTTVYEDPLLGEQP